MKHHLTILNEFIFESHLLETFYFLTWHHYVANFTHNFNMRCTLAFHILTHIPGDFSNHEWVQAPSLDNCPACHMLLGRPGEISGRAQRGWYYPIHPWPRWRGRNREWEKNKGIRHQISLTVNGNKIPQYSAIFFLARQTIKWRGPSKAEGSHTWSVYICHTHAHTHMKVMIFLDWENKN